jgi:hypothetical protein
VHVPIQLNEVGKQQERALDTLDQRRMLVLLA